MTAFIAGEPISTSLAQITVDGDLAPGRHRFTLVVQDDAGNHSAPAEVVVVVAEGRRPPDFPVPPRPEPPIFRATEPRFTTVPRPRPTREPTIRPANPRLRPG